MEFVEKARKVHGDMYDYSLVVYKNNKTKVDIICPEHGIFKQIPNSHLNGSGCPECGKINNSNRRRLSSDEFFNRSRKAHGDRYDYSNSIYIDVRSKVDIICPEHGLFSQVAGHHMNGRGCPKCGVNKCAESKKLTTTEFIKRSRETHGNVYDYSKSEYINGATKVKIICPEHGEFLQSPGHHMAGIGCPNCGRNKANNSLKHGFDKFYEKANSVHGGKFDYSKVEFDILKDMVEIICPVHGSFQQSAAAHLNGQQCPKCAIELNTEKMRSNTDDFVNKAREVHGDRYDYSKVEYVMAKVEVEIICSEHGSFFRTPNSHLNGGGCYRCSCARSNPEYEIMDYIKSFYSGELIHGDRKQIAPKELDIYVPELNLAIEYCGLYWHSEDHKSKNYHLDKLQACNNIGIRLLTIFENEWIYNSEVVKSRIRNMFKQTETRYYARDCVIGEISNQDAKLFLEENHIQGYIASSIKYGLFHKGELVSVMTFSKSRFNKNYEYELLRFANKRYTNVIGGASKLYKHFKRNHNGSVISYCDLRWGQGGVYEKLGFSLSHISQPNYFYFKKDILESRHKYQKHKLKDLLENFNEDLSEIENMQNNGYKRIFDCGNKVFVDENADF